MSLSQREKHLLRLLLEQSDYKPATYFQTKLYVSKKTIYNDLSNLAEKLTDTGLELVKIPRKGVRLEGTSVHKQKVQRLLIKEEKVLDSFSPEYRRLFIFANYLFSKQKMNYQEFSEYFFVSSQSIKKDADEILAFCDQNQLPAKITTQGLQLSGPESQRQSIFKEYLDQYLATENAPASSVQTLFSQEIVTLTNKFITEIMTAIGRQINEYFLESLAISLEIFLSRLLVHQHIEKQEDLVFEELKRMKLYMVAISFAETIQQRIGVSLEDSDVQYICSLLLAHGIEPYRQITGSDEIIIANHTEQIIKKMSQLLKVDLTHDTLLLQALLSHIAPMIHRLKNGMLVKNPLLKSIKKQYATMFTLTTYIIGNLEHTFQVSLTEDEVSFLTIHFQLAFEKVKVTSHILIVCSSGFATSELIFNRIKQSISENVVLEIIPADKLASTKLDIVDLIISTVPLGDVEPPVLYVSPLPTTEEIARISANISNLKENEKKFHSKKYQKTSLLKSFLDPVFMFTNQSFASKEQVLTFLANFYLKKDFVTVSFKESLFQREELGSTGLKTGIAIPHADPHTVKKTKLAFVTLENLIQWGDTKVQLVVLLAIAEKNMTEAKELIASIYDLFHSVEEIQWLVESNNQEELYHRLLKGGPEHVF